MPTIHFYNLPSMIFSPAYFRFDSLQVTELRKNIAFVAGCSAKVVELSLEKTEEFFLGDDGGLTEVPVRIVVDWFSGRTAGAKQEVADILLKFVRKLNLHQGLRVSFVDGPYGSFFQEESGNMVLIPGGRIPVYK